MEKRKIVQMIFVPPVPNREKDCLNLIYALCSDGSVWWMNITDGATWNRESDIPQDE